MIEKDDTTQCAIENLKPFHAWAEQGDSGIEVGRLAPSERRANFMGARATSNTSLGKRLWS